MSLYETIFIARQELSPAQVEVLASTFTDVIKSNGGDVSKTEFCGLRPLAYKIKKNKKGHYVLLNVDAPAEALKEVERQMRLNEDILRYMSIAVDELDPEPSTLMQSKTTRRFNDGAEGEAHHSHRGRSANRDEKYEGSRENASDTTDKKGDE